MGVPDWILNELIHAGDEHLDTDYVETYDVKAGTDPQDDLNVLRELGLGKNHTLVDFGAGTGSFAFAAAPLCHHVIAIDVSPAMVDRMRRKAELVGIQKLDCVQAGFLSYEHTGEAVDFVYSRHALHHLPDFWKALALKRIASIMKSGGVLYLRDLVFSFEPDEIDAVVETWLNNAPTNPEQGWTRAELITHLHEEYSTFSWLLEDMIERAGFRIQQVQHSDTRVHSAYTCIKL